MKSGKPSVVPTVYRFLGKKPPMPKRDDKRQQKRKPMTVQLVEGQDDDLIEWLRRLPDGTRQAMIKTLLRSGLKLPVPLKEDETTQRLQQLEQTNQQLLDYMQKRDQWAENEMKALHEQIAALRDELSKRPNAPAPSPEQPDVNNGRLTQDKVKQRGERIDKQKW